MNQRFDAAGAHVLGRHAIEEVVEAQERALPFPRLDDHLHGLEPHAFDRAQPKIDLSKGGDPKFEMPFVDVRGQDLDSHPAAVLDVLDKELVALGAIHLRAEDGGHELGRIMGLEKRGLIGDQCVGGTVRFIEAVAAEELDQVEDLGRFLAVQSARGGPRRNSSRLWAMTSAFFFEIALMVA